MASNNIDDNRSGDINPNNSSSSSSSRSNHKPILNLKVGEVAEQRDVGRKIARIDPEAAERFGISTGDALELSSPRKKSTVLSWPAKENDRARV